MKTGGKISVYPVLPSTAISGSIAQPGKTRAFPGGQYFANLGGIPRLPSFNKKPLSLF